MSNVIERLNSYMSAFMNVSEEDYEAIFGVINYSEIPLIDESEDINCGAIANEIEFLRLFITYIMDSFDTDTANGIFLEKIVEFYSYVRRIFDESDVNLRNRFKSMVVRNNNESWMTKWCIIDVFEYYFDSDKIYIIENYIETSLILNGYFEEGVGDNFDDWIKNEVGSSTITENTTTEFEGDRSAHFYYSVGDSVSLEQTINSVVSGDYKFSLFYKDDGNSSTNYSIYVTIQRSSDSFYYNFSSNSWQSGIVGKNFNKSSNWIYGGVYVNNVGTENLTFKIYPDENSVVNYNFDIDIVKFGEWKTYPSVKVLLRLGGTTGLFISLWQGNEDNWMDRGECEDVISPMIKDETVPYEPTPANQTWARDSGSKYMGTYSWKLTKDSTSGNGDAETFLTNNKNNTDMHGLVAGNEYTLVAWILADEIVNAHKLIVHEYYSGGWNTHEFSATQVVDYERASINFTLNAGTTGFAISVFIDTNAVQNATLNIDNIRLFEGSDTNIENAAFLDNDYIAGVGGGYVTQIYQDLLDRIKAGGVKALAEMISD